jgi:type I restriction-modification system DNA methylase subunit
MALAAVSCGLAGGARLGAGRERAQSFLTTDHIDRIVTSYQSFEDAPGFARVRSLTDIRTRNYSLAIPLYVEAVAASSAQEVTTSCSVTAAIAPWLKLRNQTRTALARLVPAVLQPEEQHLELAGEGSFELVEQKGRWPRVRFGDVRRVSTTLRHSDMEFSEYRRLSFAVC